MAKVFVTRPAATERALAQAGRAWGRQCSSNVGGTVGHVCSVAQVYPSRLTSTGQGLARLSVRKLAVAGQTTGISGQGRSSEVVVARHPVPLGFIRRRHVGHSRADEAATNVLVRRPLTARSNLFPSSLDSSRTYRPSRTRPPGLALVGQASLSVRDAHRVDLKGGKGYRLGH